MTRILIVEDDELFRKSLKRALRRDGYYVVEAAGTEDAIPQIELHKFDLVITDWKLPVSDGFDVLRAVRDLRPQTPSILISGYLGPLEIAEAKRLGASSVLTKPVSADALRSAVLMALFARNSSPRVKWLE